MRRSDVLRLIDTRCGSHKGSLREVLRSVAFYLSQCTRRHRNDLREIGGTGLGHHRRSRGAACSGLVPVPDLSISPSVDCPGQVLAGDICQIATGWHAREPIRLNDRCSAELRCVFYRITRLTRSFSFRLAFS